MTDKELPIIEHLIELRKRLIIILLFLSIAITLSYIFFDPLMKIILQPLGESQLMFTNILEPFMARFRLALWFSFFITFPLITYEVLAFIAPGLKKSEKKYLYFSFILIVLLFSSGVVFCYFFILPAAIKWLLSQSGTHLKQLLTIDNYLSFSIFFMLAFGASFQTPLVVWLLSKLGIFTPKQLIKHWRIAVIVILFVAAAITPDWSPVSMILTAIPMIVLYLLGIVLAKYF